MDKDDDGRSKTGKGRVIRGGDGAIIGYWFPEDFWAYEEYLMREHTQLLERVRAVPVGTEFPSELWLEMRSTFDSFSQKIGRKYTHYDVTSSTASVQGIAQGASHNDETHH